MTSLKTADRVEDEPRSKEVSHPERRRVPRHRLTTTLLSVVLALGLVVAGGSAASADVVVVPSLAVGDGPSGVAVSPDGSKAYVVNVLDDTVSVIGTSTDTVSGTISVGALPYFVAFTPDGTKAYVTSRGTNAVTVIDPATDTVTGSIAVGSEPIWVAINHAGTRAYVTNRISNSVSVIDTATDEVIATIPVGAVPSGVAVLPDDSRVYVANQGTASVSVIDAATNTAIGTISGLPGQPSGVSASPDGNRVYVATQTGHAVIVIDTSIDITAPGAPDPVELTIPTGALTQPYLVSIAPGGDRAYVTLLNADAIRVLDLTTHTLGATIPVGQWPNQAAFSPTQAKAYVGNYDDDTVTVIAVDSAPQVIPATPPQAVLGSAYSVTVAIRAYPAPLVTQTGTLPPGLSFDPATGIVSGTPTVPGSFTFTVSAENIFGDDSEQFTIVVAAPPAQPLPATGTSVQPLLLGTMLLLAGALVLRLRARRGH